MAGTVDVNLVSTYVQELYPYTKAEMENIVGTKDENVFQKYIEKLKKLGVLAVRGKKENIDRGDIADCIDRDVSDTDFQDGLVYTFSFVGIVVLAGKVFKCYPKYQHHFPSKLSVDDLHSFKQVLYVVEKYNTSQDNHNTWIKEFGHQEDDGNYNKLSLVLYLLSDYYENGLYTEYHKVYEQNGEGEIQWERTIDEFFPLLKDNRPVYPELITTRFVTDENNYFERLHACVLTKAVRFLREIDVLDIFDNIIDEEVSEEELDEFGEQEYILKRIENELSLQFNSRKQKVLHGIYTFIANSSQINIEDNTLVYGSHSFYHIWEAVCKDVFADALDVQIGELSVPIDTTKYNKYMTIKDLICKPKWYNADEVAVGESKETMELDSVSIFRHDGKLCFAILDSKYYLTKIGKQVSHAPGIVDIEKEYFYQMALQEFIKNNRFEKVSNCFIMPISDQDNIVASGLCLGSVSLPMFEKMSVAFDNGKLMKLCKIGIVKLDPHIMYDWYLNGIDRNCIQYGQIMDCIMKNAVDV